MRRDDLIPIGSPRPAALVALAVWSLLGACAAPAKARVTRIVVDEKRSPAYDGESFGRAGTYERIIGRVFGELDPRDRRNAVISDLDLAPRNARGMVEYVATFTLWQPTDPAKASGVLIYAVPNRGNRLFFPAFHLGGEPGDGFFFRRGDAILMSGWQGDVVAAAPRRSPSRWRRTPTVPASPARCSHVSSTCRPVQRRSRSPRRTRRSISIPGGRPSRRRAAEDGAVIPIATRRLGVRRLPQAPFPGTPDPTRSVVKGGFDPASCTNWSTRRRIRWCSASGWRRHATWSPSSGMRTGPTKARARPIRGKVSHVDRSGHLAVRQFRPHVPPSRIQRGRVRPDRVGRANAAHRRAPAPHQLPVRHPGGAAGMFEPGSEACCGGATTRTTRTRPDGVRPARPLSRLGHLSRRFRDVRLGRVLGPADVAEPGGHRRRPRHPVAPDRPPLLFPGTTHGGGRGGFSTRVQASDRFVTGGQSEPAVRDDAGLTRRADRLGRERHGTAAEPVSPLSAGRARPPRSPGDGLPRDSRLSLPDTC